MANKKYANREKLSKFHLIQKKGGGTIGKFEDLTGRKFGRLTIIERDMSKDKKRGAFWICECECGNRKSVKASSLKNGSTQSCGCLNKDINSKPKDLPYMIGKRFGKLVVVERAGAHVSKGGQKTPVWLCQCDCGNEKLATSKNLTSGRTKSCGCMPTKRKGSGLHDLTGQRFGKLVVTKRYNKDYKYESKGKITTSPLWVCKCDCGNEVVVQGGNLRSGNTTNCGRERVKSKSEAVISEFLTSYNIRYVPEFSFDDLRNKRGNLLRFDFAIFDKSGGLFTLVEYQGPQHYKDCGWFGLYQREYSDKMKREYCELHNISLYEIRYDEDLEQALVNLLAKINKEQLE